MTPKRIEIGAFMSHEGTAVDLPDRGLVLVVGPNGAGKSAVVEALTWALWGETLRAGDPVPPSGDARVRVDFDGGLSVARRRKGGRTKLAYRTEPGAAWIEAATATETQRAIARWIGDSERFRHTSVFSRELMSAFSAATDKERKLLLERLLGLEWVEGAYARVLADAREARAKLAADERAHEMARARADEATSAADRIKAAAPAHAPEDLGPFRAKVAWADAGVSTVRAEVAAAERRSREAAEAFAAVQEARRAARSAASDGTAEAEARVRDVRAAGDAAVEGVESVAKDAKATAAAAVEWADVRLRESRDAAAVRIDATRRAFRVVEAHDVELFRIGEELKSLRGLTGACPTCRRSIGEGELEPCIAEVEARRVAAQSAADAARAGHVAVKADEDRAMQAVKLDEQALARAREEARSAADRADAVVGKAKDDARRDVVAAEASLRAAQDAARAAAAREDDDVAAARAAERAAYEAFNAARKAETTAVAALHEARAALDAAEAREAAAADRAREHAARAEEAVREADRHAVAARGAKDAADVSAREVALLDVVAAVYGPKGARARLLGRYLAALSSRATSHVRRMGLPWSIRVDPTTVNKGGTTSEEIALRIEGGRGYDAASSGERRRVDVAILLALASLAASRPDAPRFPLFLDEVMDCLDVAGVEATSALLAELAADRSVVLVTHSPELRAHLDVAAVWSVRRGGSGASEIAVERRAA